MSIKAKISSSLILSVFAILGFATMSHAALNQFQVDSILALIEVFGVEQSVIDNVRASLTGSAVSTTSTLTIAPINTSAWCHSFNTNLELGDRGSEVSALRTALSRGGYSLDTSLDFDHLLLNTVIAFQQKYKSVVLTPVNLLRGTGYVGPSTRAQLNRLYGCADTTADSATPSTSTTSTASPVSDTVVTIPGFDKTIDRLQTRDEIVNVLHPHQNVSVYGTSLRDFNMKGKLVKGSTKKDVDLTGILTQSVSFKVPDLANGDYQFYLHNDDEVISNTIDVYINTYEGRDKPSITLETPKGGELFTYGMGHNITWTTVDFRNRMVDISLTDDDQNFIKYIIRNVRASGSYNWLPDNTTPGAYKIRINSNDGDADLYDISGANFLVGSHIKSLTVTGIPGGIEFTRGVNNTINWQTNGIFPSATVFMEMFGNGITPYRLVDSTPNDGSYEVNITTDVDATSVKNDTYSIKVCAEVENSDYCDTIDTISVVSP